MKKVLLGLLGLIVVVVAGGGLFVALKKPAQRPASAEKIQATPEMIARGKYLADMACLHCHTEPEPTRWSFLGNDDKRGSGGLCWDESMGFPGKVCSANITPDPRTGIGQWTDGEILRAIREGVSRDGRALVPIMSYDDFATLSDDDARAIVAYLRTLPPIEKAHPKPAVKPPLSIVMKFLPKPLDGPVAAPAADALSRGRYLTTIAGCKGCHTPVDERHVPLPGKDFSGGQAFKLPWVTVTSANITPHATGLGDRTRENFIAQFKAFSGPEIRDAKVNPAQNTVMPWLTAAQLTEEDLGAIYDYLKSVPPVENTVQKIAPPVAANAPAAAANPGPTPAGAAPAGAAP